MNGAWQVHNAGLKPLFRQAMIFRKQFDSFTIDHVFRCLAIFQSRSQHSRSSMYDNSTAFP